MDSIYEYLKLDHKKVADLFKQFDKAPSFTAKKDYVNMICKELLIHAETEQQTFYKALEDAGLTQEINHAEKEHSNIKNKITEVLAFTQLDETWEKKVKELQKEVEHHVHEEEDKIFDDAKKFLNDEDAYVLREQMHDLKQKVLANLDKNTFR